MRLRHLALLAGAAGAGGCALRSDVTKLRLQLDAQQQAAARSDSVTQANLSSIARLVQGVLDSLAAQQGVIAGMRGDLKVDLYNVQQQLMAVQQFIDRISIHSRAGIISPDDHAVRLADEKD